MTPLSSNREHAQILPHREHSQALSNREHSLDRPACRVDQIGRDSDFMGHCFQRPADLRQSDPFHMWAEIARFDEVHRRMVDRNVIRHRAFRQQHDPRWFLASHIIRHVRGGASEVGFRDDLTRDDAVNLACRSLWEAADADSATGGPDALRKVYPVVATITGGGWDRLDDTDLAVRFEAIANEAASR